MGSFTPFPIYNLAMKFRNCKRHRYFYISQALVIIRQIFLTSTSFILHSLHFSYNVFPKKMPYTKIKVVFLISKHECYLHEKGFCHSNINVSRYLSQNSFWQNSNIQKDACDSPWYASHVQLLFSYIFFGTLIKVQFYHLDFQA